MKPLHPPRFLPLILAAAACVLAALCLWQVLQLKSQLKDTTLSQAEQLSAMDAALQSLPHQMEDALHTQASLLANYDWHYGDLNPETGTLPVTFTAVPKEQTASVTTATLVCNGKSYPVSPSRWRFPSSNPWRFSRSFWQRVHSSESRHWTCRRRPARRNYSTRGSPWTPPLPWKMTSLYMKTDPFPSHR